jgi:ribosomal protein L24
MFIGDISKRASTNVSHELDTPMKGDHVVVTEGFYIRKFGVISKVDMKSQALAFFSESIHQHIWVLMRMTAFNPNPTALQYTQERGYNVVAGDIIQVIRGNPLCAFGTVLRVNLDNKTLTFKDTQLKEVSSHQFCQSRFVTNNSSLPPP